MLPSLRGRDLEGFRLTVLVKGWLLVHMQGTKSVYQTSRDHCAVISLLTCGKWPAGMGITYASLVMSPAPPQVQMLPASVMLGALDNLLHCR